MRRLAIMGALSLLLGSAAQAADISPDWAARPSADAAGLVYPALARQFGIEGYARIACKVGMDGTAKACVVSAESPAGLGFGPAALALAPGFKLKPGPSDETPVEIPVRFKPPRFPLPPAEVRPAPPVAAVAAARRVMAAQATADYLDNRYAQLMAGLVTGPSDGVDRKTVDLGLQVLSAAARQALPAHLEAAAQVYASYQSTEDLETNAAFGESKVGIAYRALSPRLGAYEDALVRNAVEAIIAGAVCPPSETCEPRTPAPISPAPISQPSAGAMSLATQIAAIDLRMTPVPPGKLRMLVAGATKLSDSDLQDLASRQWTRIQGLAADAYAHQLDEDQLRGVLAFKTSPAGQALRQASPALTVAVRRLERENMQGALDAAAEAFCKQRDCQLVDPPPAATRELEAVVISAAPFGL